jgi:hypothetical protein
MIEQRELKKISLAFRDVASRALRSDSSEAPGNIRRLLKFVDQTSVLREEVDRAAQPGDNIEELWNKARESRRERLDLPEDPTDELGLLHQVLKFFAKSDEGGAEFWRLCYGYAGITQLKECVSEVMDDIVGKYVGHLNRVLELALLDSADPAYDPRRVSISISGGENQVNIANDQATLNAQANFGPAADEILQLARQLSVISADVPEIKEIASAVAKEVASPNPNKFTLAAARSALENIASIGKASGDIVTIGLKLAGALHGVAV